jgi:prepilin-type N-terminal cleavage/methylation domain-containing protein
MIFNYLSLKTTKNNLLKKKEGFTLIETLVAITILLLSIIGPLDIASKGLFAAFYARDEISAYYLAQEGIEFVRNLRDNNYLNSIKGVAPSLWLDNIDPSCFFNSNNDDGCAINPVSVFNNTGTSIVPCASTCPILNYGESTGIFSLNTANDDSKFTRKVLITLEGSDIVSSDSALIEVTVSWHTGGLFSSTKSFVLRERIFNWNQ